jgi:hypothetical protein
MRFNTLILLILFSCTSYKKKDFSYSQLDLVKLENKLTKKDLFGNDTLNFSNFQEYCKVVPDLKLPFKGDFHNLPNYPDTVQIFMQRCNYSGNGNLPLAKIIKDEFIAIFYSEPIEGLHILMSIYDLNGNIIDSMHFKNQNIDDEDKMNNINIDKNCIITTTDKSLKRLIRVMQNGEIREM